MDTTDSPRRTPKKKPDTSPRPDPPAKPTAKPLRTTTPTQVTRPRCGAPAATPWYQDAPRSGMDLPSGVEPSKENKADDNPGRRSFTSLSCSILANELYVAARESSFSHFKEVIIEEITKLLCPQYNGSISQEPAQGPPPGSAEMAADEAPYLALVWKNESQVTMIKLADDPSKQMENFLSDSGRFGACYTAPVKSFQEASMSEVADVNFGFNNQQSLGRPSSSDAAPKESRRYHKLKPVTMEASSPSNVPTIPPKKRKRGNMSSQQGPNHLKGKRPIDHQALPTTTNIDLPKKKRQRKTMSVSSPKVQQVEPSSTTAKAPCDAANLKSKQAVKRKRTRSNVSKKEKLPPMIPPRSNDGGSARTSINGWQWLKWSQNATDADKAKVRGWNSMKQIQDCTKQIPNCTKQSQQVDARAARAAARNQLAKAKSPGLVTSLQIKGRTKELRLERSKIHGLGVRAVNQIKQGEFIVQYIGEVIRKPISDIREIRYQKDGVCDYFFKIDVNYVIDATPKGGIARYINHSCEPNCDTRVIPVDGKKKICIYAKRLIRAGEELTYNYKFPFDKEKVPCLCGSRRCRGSMT